MAMPDQSGIPYDQILPEEAVAIGAAIYGNVLMAAR